MSDNECPACGGRMSMVCEGDVIRFVKERDEAKAELNQMREKLIKAKDVGGVSDEAWRQLIDNEKTLRDELERLSKRYSDSIAELGRKTVQYHDKNVELLKSNKENHELKAEVEKLNGELREVKDIASKCWYANSCLLNRKGKQE